jgi:nucleoside-triphosphatase
MPHNYFITGEPKAGKTTLLKEIVRELRDKGLRVGGFVSPEERHHGTRTAFYVMDVESGRQETLASVDGDGPKVSKYHVDVKSFESVAVPAMERFDEYDVLVIDEIGRMEMKSAAFVRLLDQVLESRTPLIATLHRDYVDRYAQAGEVFELLGNNREAVFTTLLGKAKEAFEKKAIVAVKKAPAERKIGKKLPGKKVVEEKKAGKAKPPGKGKAAERKKKAMKPGAGKKEEAAKPKAEKAAREKPARKEEKKPEKKGLLNHLKELFHG